MFYICTNQSSVSCVHYTEHWLHLRLCFLRQHTGMQTCMHTCTHACMHARTHARTHTHTHTHTHTEKYSPSEYQLRAMDQSDLHWAHLPLCSWSPWCQKWKGSLPLGLTACRSQSADTGSAGCCSAGLDLHPATAGPASLSRLNDTNQDVKHSTNVKYCSE